MKKCILSILVVLFFISKFYPQEQDSCRVLLKEISSDYTGPCKDGLAHGTGTAKGTDTYIGTFKEGLPDGKGKYIYENGNFYSGYWSKGLKNGYGKFKSTVNGKTYILKGYWKNGDYVGTSDPEAFYRVTYSSYVNNYSFKEVDDDKQCVRISFLAAFVKYTPQNLNIIVTSGQLVNENKDYVIYNFATPMNCSIQYVIQTSGGYKQCNIKFDILKNGSYEVTFIND